MELMTASLAWHGGVAGPRRVVVDHAGTWEVARDALLHEVLIRRVGHPAALAIIMAQVCGRQAGSP